MSDERRGFVTFTPGVWTLFDDDGNVVGTWTPPDPGDEEWVDDALDDDE